jgi:hypothetical protein
MNHSDEPLEILWDNLLSREPNRIRSAYYSRSELEQSVVVEHLRKMASEEGWHPQQRISALAALKALEIHL